MDKKTFAFTLIELLVVIAIIGILSGLIVVSMNGITQKATIAKAQVFSNSLKNSLMMNLVSEWKFDELSSAVDGTLIQDSWNGNNNGTLDINSSATDTADKLKSTGCVSGKCIVFDGIDDYIEINDSDSLDVNKNLTISLWIKKMGTGTSVTPGIIAKRVSSSGWGLIWQTTASANNISSRIYQSDGTAINLDPFDIGEGQWELITLVADNSTNKIRVYKNSQIQGAEKTYDGTIFAGNSPMYIGQQSASYFNGWIDDVRFYNAAMPTSQIKEQYYAGLNSLLANGGVSLEEYSLRINQLSINK